jgi:hypothetical protein
MFLLNIIFSLVNIIMKIAVVGIGVAGAYLMNRLSDDADNHVVGFERMPKAQHDAVCAWATCQNVMSGLAKNCGLNFDQYILHDGKYMKVDLKETNGIRDNSINIRLKGMVSYDKLKLIQDMIRGTKVEFGRVPKKENLKRILNQILISLLIQLDFIETIFQNQKKRCGSHASNIR